MASTSQYGPMAQRWYAFHDALEQVVAGTAQDPSEAERAMWSAFDAHRHCYLEYSASLLPPLSALADEPGMTTPLWKYYVYRRKLHAFLVGPGDDMSLLDLRTAREHHECAYREYLAEHGRSTCRWIRALANKLQCPRMRTLRLISEYPDTHQLAAACERIDGVVHIPTNIRDLQGMETLCAEDVRLIEHAFTLLYERIIEKRDAKAEGQPDVSAVENNAQIVAQVMATPRPSARRRWQS